MHSPPSSELIFERSVARTAGLLALALAMTGVSAFCLSRGLLQFAWKAWWLGMLFGPLGIAINTVALFRSGPQVIFNEHGIHDLRTSWGLISWAEIVSLSIVTIYAKGFLCIYLADEGARVARLSWWARLALLANHAKGLSAFKLRFAGLSPGFDAACEFLATYHADKLVGWRPPTPSVSAPPG